MYKKSIPWNCDIHCREEIEIWLHICDQNYKYFSLWNIVSDCLNQFWHIDKIWLLQEQAAADCKIFHLVHFSKIFSFFVSLLHHLSFRKKYISQKYFFIIISNLKKNQPNSLLRICIIISPGISSNCKYNNIICFLSPLNVITFVNVQIWFF